MPIFEKAIQTFQRTTHVTTGTFRLRLSIHANEFLDEMLPQLLSAGILKKIARGPGAHDRFKLGVPMAVISAALAECHGSYERCLEIIRKGKYR